MAEYTILVLFTKMQLNRIKDILGKREYLKNSR